MSIKITDDLYELAMTAYDRSDVHSQGVQFAVEAVLNGGTPEQKRELASQLLTAANEQEGFPSDR